MRIFKILFFIVVMASFTNCASDKKDVVNEQKTNSAVSENSPNITAPTANTTKNKKSTKKSKGECKEDKLDFRRIVGKTFLSRLNKYKIRNKMELLTHPRKLEKLGMKQYTKKSKELNTPRYRVNVSYNYIKEDSYYANLYAIHDKELGEENIKYVIKTYDNDKNEMGHIDLAAHYGNDQNCLGGKIDCHGIISVYQYEQDKVRVFEITETGKVESIETKSIFAK